MKTFTLGRDHDHPISIDNTHSSVSHTHATITIDGDKWILEDSGSTNGTFIDDNGSFRRYQRVSIKPDTWIRLGEQGHRGYYFKARRVLRPNDYREDFEELYEKYQEFEDAKKRLESQRRISKFVAPALILICYGLSYCLPGIKNSPDLSRLLILLPGLFSPVITHGLLNNLEKRIKKLQEELICPKCRRPMGKSEIINREHTICKAH